MSLDDVMQRAQRAAWKASPEGRDVRELGRYSKGTRRVVVEQRVSLCRPEHPRWFPLDNITRLVCYVCYPPVVPYGLVEAA